MRPPEPQHQMPLPAPVDSPATGVSYGPTVLAADRKSKGPVRRAEPALDLRKTDDYCTGATVALAVNGSVGTAAVVLCQIVLPAFTANERVPVVPNVWGAAVA